MRERNGRTDRSWYSFGAVTAWVVLALMLLFAGLSVALIALGGQAYRSILRAADENTQRRASVGYVIERIRAYDSEGDVFVRRTLVDEEEVDVLVLKEIIEGDVYETRIYCAGGKLREQFVAADVPLESAEDGETIASLERFTATMQPGWVELVFGYLNEEEDIVHAVLHSAQEGAV